MPTYAPASSTVVQTPAVLATLNEYIDGELLPMAYRRTFFYGLLFGKSEGADAGLGGRPTVKLPSFRRPQRKTMGGTQAEVLVNFETNGNAQAYYGLQELRTGINRGGTKLYSPWAHYTMYTAMDRTTAKENSGPGKQYDILKSQVEQEMRFKMRLMETDLLGTNTDIVHGTQDSFPGLQHWNSSSPSTGTVHGLSRVTYTPFRNQTGTCTSFASTGLDDMATLYYAIAGTNQSEPPDVILTTPTIHGYYAKAAQAVHRIVGNLDGVDLGVRGTLQFKGIPLVHSSDNPSGRMDWLTTQYIYACVLEGSDWESETPGKPNNVAVTFEVRRYFAGAVICRRPEVNGVLTVSGG